jgi:hypothetical protein
LSLTVPALQLQQEWVANLQGALACGSRHQLDTAAASQQQQQQQQVHQVPRQQPQQPQQQELNWLRKLLQANAAAPLEQLTQLDLSLEQLPGLHGLDVLCPLLTNVAVNMNGLRSLEGLRGCSRLVHLSAQVRSRPPSSLLMFSSV